MASDKTKTILLNTLFATAVVTLPVAVLAPPNTFKLAFDFSEACEIGVDQSRLDKLHSKEFYAPGDLYGRTYGQYPFVLIGDTNHTDKAIDDFFYSAENIKIMAASGIRHVFVEMAKENQEVVDKVADGSLSPEDYCEQSKSRSLWFDGEEKKRQNIQFAKAVLLMKKLGIQVHCADTVSRIPQKHMNPFTSGVRDLANYLHSTCGDNAALHGKIRTKYNLRSLFFHPVREIKMRMASQAVMIYRDDDKERIALIEERCKGEPSVIIFGAAHFEGRNSFRTLIGPERSVRIDLYGREALYADSYDKHNISRGKNGADFVHMIAENEAYQL